MKINGYEIKPGADLREANLRRANLNGASYCVTNILKARWDKLSDDLTTELMKWDAHATPTPSKFMEWKKGGPCPAQEHLRIFVFEENRELFRQGKPTMTLWELWAAVAKELEISI